MAALHASATSRAVDFILHGSPSTANASVRILDYRDKAVFRDLWLNGLDSITPVIAGAAFDWNQADQQVVIVGNDPPDDIFDNNQPSLKGINFRDHFTATSWLAAWKVKFTPSAEERRNGKAEPMAKIAVLDDRESGLGGGAARALQTILGARDSSGQTTLISRTAVLNSPSLAAICQWLKPAKADSCTTPPHLPELLKTSIWNELTSDREQNHAFSNVLGAFLLSSQVGSGTVHPGNPWVQDYFLALVRACGIEAGLNQVALQVGDRKENRHQVWLHESLQSAIPGAVLIDDMGGIWSRFVAGALGFYGQNKQRFELFGGPNFLTSIRDLPSRLTKFSNSGRRQLLAADILGSSSGMKEDFALFLDLRLFAKGDSDEAKDFHRNLLVLGNHLLTQKRRRLVWLEKNKTAIAEFQDELAGTGGHPRETLLPRLISLLDPTLPIIIFSSTHRTDLIEPFRDYGNIITTFQKPVLSGLSRDWPMTVKELHTDFSSAVERAAGILRVRELLRPLHKLLAAA